ncbi:MAG: hypothetical protein Q4B90_10970 [Eubacteriales bacterium]|nr:hypothetical protein [Eubacteriales bacterium]
MDYIDNYYLYEEYEAEQERRRRIRHRHAEEWGDDEEEYEDEYTV